MIKLEIKDRKLLAELDKNSRQSIKQLAKKMNLSKDGIKYRMNKLEKEGVIKSYRAIVDISKLRYISFRVFLKFYNTSPEKEMEMVNYLLKNKNLLWLVKVEGAWDINTWFAYKKISEMNEFYKKFLKKYNKNIDKKEIGIYTDVFYLGKKYLHNKKTNTLKIISLPSEEKISSTEERILRILTQNARSQIIEIAKRTGTTPKTIIKKIKDLQNKKIICGYTTELDLKKINYEYYKINISLTEANETIMKQLYNFAQNNENIVFVDFVLGGSDFEIEVQIENIEKLRELIEKLREKFSHVIKNIENLSYYEEFRLRFFPSER